MHLQLAGLAASQTTCNATLSSAPYFPRHTAAVPVPGTSTTLAEGFDVSIPGAVVVQQQWAQTTQWSSSRRAVKAVTLPCARGATVDPCAVCDRIKLQIARRHGGMHCLARALLCCGHWRPLQQAVGLRIDSHPASVWEDGSSGSGTQRCHGLHETCWTILIVNAGIWLVS